MRILFAIANETHETYGMGDCGKELRIRRQGPYGSGEYPALFTSRENAQTWIDSQEWKAGLQVVEMTLIEP